MTPADWPADWQFQAINQQASMDVWSTLAWLALMALLVYVGIQQQRESDEG
jgi:hypothetical protein